MTDTYNDNSEDLEPLVGRILAADELSEDVQIKISDYRSNMSATVFEIGEPLDTLLNRIKEIVNQ